MFKEHHSLEALYYSIMDILSILIDQEIIFSGKDLQVQKIRVLVSPKTDYIEREVILRLSFKFHEKL